VFEAESARVPIVVLATHLARLTARPAQAWQQIGAVGIFIDNHTDVIIDVDRTATRGSDQSRESDKVPHVRNVPRSALDLHGIVNSR
jgi:hypothetical protein